MKMKFNKLNIIVFIGLVGIVGVITMQLVMLSEAYKFERKEVGEKIHFALQDVVTKIYLDNSTEAPVDSPIKKVSDDYYVVNVNDVFEASILEYYLKNEFIKAKLDLDYEYAIYDCSGDAMVYGEYINMEGQTVENQSMKCVNCFTKRPGLVYYFAIRFPKMTRSSLNSLGQYWIYTAVLFLVLVIYVYSVFLLLKQKRYTELQKDFINNMTHEFKTPLSSILIAGNYAAKQPEIEDNPKLNRYLNIIVEQGNKLNQHVERILSVAKNDSGIGRLQKIPFGLNDTLELIKENASIKFERAHITLTAPDTKYTILADEFHVYNILYNVVENAIKYGPANPEVDMKVIPQPKGVMLEISDNGPGIPAEHIDFVFDRFYRVPRENKTDIEGFGIGLFYVKKICELHGWKITLRNNTGAPGVTVSITIPKSSLA
jgi:two-component system phosphate regulon sensor histidine kinase PhoR